MTRVRALIVEDQTSLSDIYRDALNLMGIETHCVFDGQQALDTLETANPDIILLDMNLPKVSGHYVYKHIRAQERFNQTPILIATANAVIANSLTDSLTDLDILMVKPISVSQLQQIVKRLI